MRTLLLARHALAASNRDTGIASCAIPGEGLTRKGAAQARRLGERLAGERIDLGVCSELRRTAETLELALDGRAVPTLVVPELDEIGFGVFGEGPLDDYRAWAVSHSPTEPPPGGGESRADAAARFARGLGIVLARPEDVVLAIMHALVARYVLDAAAGRAPSARIAPVEHAVVHALDREDVGRAVRQLEAWSREPHFRDPSIEG